MDMFYIYKYTNNINGHCYIGQTNNFERRKREHLSTSFNPNSCSYNDLIHKKIREYGIENFTIEVLETIYSNDREIANEREQYWIKYYQSFRDTGKGYNSNDGGGAQNHSSVLSSDELQEVKRMIKNKESFYDIEKKFNISASFISSINHGVYFRDENETYPLCQYYKKDEEYDDLIDLLINSNLKLTEIAKQLNLGYSTVKKINQGTLRKGLYPSYPIRKNIYPKAIKAINLLQTTELSNKEIAQEVGYSEENIRRINLGEIHHQDNLTYPLRNL